MDIKSLREQQLETIRKWQAGEKTPELAKRFEDISVILIDSGACSFDDDVYDAVHELNNFIQATEFERLLKRRSKL